jgi:Fe-S-cluster-containing hydrogenase component 2
LKRIIVNAEKCAGCRQCEMVCSFHHSDKFSPSISRVTVKKDDRYGLDYPVMCRQCNECPPIENCPTKAINRFNGVIKIDLQVCIGCGQCVKSCKYDAVKLYQDKAIICDQCSGEPECVNRCPTSALDYIETAESLETPGQVFTVLKQRWGIVD